MARSRTPKFDASEVITNEIIRIIECGVLPWRKPWTAGGSSRPLRVGGEPYQGVNNFLLTMRTVMAGHSSPFWMTLPQANALDAKVRKGEKSSVVVYYGQSRKDAGGEDDQGKRDDRSEEARIFRFQKSYRVFNACQIEGLPDSFYPDSQPAPEHPTSEPIPHMQAFFDAIHITTVFTGTEAYYLPPVDIRTRPVATVAASKPQANAILPLTFTSFVAPRDNTPVSNIHARYRPQRIEIAGAQEHPTPLVESIAMASVAPPVPSSTGSDDLRLPARLIEDGHLSEAQLETIIMAHDAHGRDLPGRMRLDDDQTKLTRADDDPEGRAYRLGYFLGDGTGCGKGRECAGLILVNWLAGRRKAIWVSKSATLIEDAIRDWTDLGGSPADIQPLSKWKPDQPIPMGDGILFITYATLRSAGKCGATRLSQILDWMGDGFEGVLAFDEAHAMQNAAGSGEGRGVKPSQQGLAGLRLQLAAPRARVFYISATGATSMHNLAYAARLGLSGQGPDYPFPSRESFVSAMEAGGVAAMEVVARDLKTLGLYTARALSFEGVEYDVHEHALTSAQIEIYDAYAGAFRTIHHNLEAALTATGVTDASGETNASAARASAKSRFESTKQRFFNHLLMGMKAPTIIRAIADDLAAGNACVIQVVSTGESLLKRRLETMDPEDDLVEGALTPRDYVLSGAPDKT